MPFEKVELTVPQRLVTNFFVLRPIVEADAELDYAAVVESKEFLRGWEQTGWPADDFTVADNREDLAKLELRHNRRESFTYTVMNPDESECLGCVYISPPDSPIFERSRIEPFGPRNWSHYPAMIHFWVRKSQLPQGMDHALFDTLREWLARQWRWERVLFLTTAAFTQQVELFERFGFQVQFKIHDPKTPAPELAFGAP